MPAWSTPMADEAAYICDIDGEDVQLVHVPPAQTNNDALVYFPLADVIMASDYFNTDQYPYIDREDGDTPKGMLDGISRLIGMAGPNTKIMAGRGPVGDRNLAIESET
jgi:cyclase